jgi:hypothetical protein
MKAILGKLNDELLANLARKASPFCTQVDAAVAYAGRPDHPLLQECKEKQIRLRFFGLLDDGGAVGTALLNELVSWGPLRAEVRLVKGNYHPKVIWWRGFGAYVGSANLTDKAWFNNIEAGIFLDEDELVSTGVGDQLDELLEHLGKVSVPVTTETIEKLRRLDQDRRSLDQQATKLRKKFGELFSNVPENTGLVVKPPKGTRENTALRVFTAEWTETLQLMRGLRKEFIALNLHPSWVTPDAHPVVHFDQFLHGYYYDYVRGGIDQDEDAVSGLQKVEASFDKHKANPGSALLEAARWWAGLASDRYGEELFIKETAPAMRDKLSRAAIKEMTLQSFTEALLHVNAFKVHARQVKNSEFGLPIDHHESQEDRIRRLCGWLWERRSAAGKTVRDTLEFVLWGTSPSDMEQRLWLAFRDDEYRIGHFGQSTLGEAVGWARPDDYPPRNNRTNKALRALGHDVKLFSNT